MRYGNDYNNGMFGGNRDFGGIERAYDMDYNAGYNRSNFGGSNFGGNNNSGNNNSGNNNSTDNDRFGRGWNTERGGQYRGTDYAGRDMSYNRGMRGYDRGFNNDFGRNDRMVFGARGGRYDRDFGGRDRDMGDRLQEGWNDLKQGARRMFSDRDNRRGW